MRASFCLRVYYHGYRDIIIQITLSTYDLYYPQVTSTPNCSDLGPNNATEFISRHSIEGKFTFVDQRYEKLKFTFYTVILNG